MNATPDLTKARRSSEPWHTFPVTIRRVCAEAPNVMTYDFEFDNHADAQQYAFAPGQFNMLYVPGAGEAAISIAGRTSEGRFLKHTIRTVGVVTQAIAKGGVGMSLGLRGPFGTSWPVDFFSHPFLKRDVIVVAGGIGLAPLRSLVLFLIQHREKVGSVRLLIGARSPEDVVYESELNEWSENGVEIHVTVDRPSLNWRGQVGVVTLLLGRIAIPSPQSTLVMTCGPEVMMRYVAKSAMDRKIPTENVWLTLERNMNCAIGLCGHCQLGPKFICKDGPVFRYDDVRDLLRVQHF